MEKNAGTIDRIVRVVIGAVLLYAVATGMVQGIVRCRAPWPDDAGYRGTCLLPAVSGIEDQHCVKAK